MADNRALITAYCRDGDTEAFRKFYRLQTGKLWKFLIARGCAPEDAYDLVAEAYLKFIQNVCRDPSAPVALLYRIALNLRIDRYRRDQASPVDNTVDLETLNSTCAEEPDDYAYVRSLVSSLPENEQNLILMRYWIGLSHKEAAQALDLPEGTVRRRCVEILDRLRQRLDK